MRESYYAYNYLWTNDKISIKAKKQLFIGNVDSAATSGMEAETTPDTEYQTIEKVRMQLLRKMLGKLITKKNGDKWSTISNNEIRKNMELPTIKSIVEKRKLKWLKDIIQSPDDNIMLRAALTGDLELDTNNLTNFTPWIEEMTMIITKAAHRNNSDLNVAEKIRGEGNVNWIWTEGRILYLNEKMLHDYEEETTLTDITSTCPEWIERQAYGLTDRNKINGFVPGNNCPLCEVNLACKRTAQNHVANTEKNWKTKGIANCITKNMNKGKEHKKKIPNKWTCEECCIEIKGERRITEHCRKHLQQIIYGTEEKFEVESKKTAFRKLFNIPKQTQVTEFFRPKTNGSSSSNCWER